MYRRVSGYEDCRAIVRRMQLVGWLVGWLRRGLADVMLRDAGAHPTSLRGAELTKTLMLK